LSKAYDAFKKALDITTGAELSLLLLNPASQQQQQQEQQQLHHCCPPEKTSCCFPIQELEQYASFTQNIETILQQGKPCTSNSSSSSFWNTFTDTGSAGTDTSNKQSNINHSDNETFQKSPYFVYEEAFVLNLDDAVDLTEKAAAARAAAAATTTILTATIVSKQVVAIFKAKIIFNLAVTLHRGGKCVDETSISKALQLYDLCLQYTRCTTLWSLTTNNVKNNNNNVKKKNDSPLLLLAIATLNNKAHIFYEFSEFTSFRTALDALFTTMTFLPRRTKGRSTTSNATSTTTTTSTSSQTGEREHIQAILFNLYMMRDITCARAA